MNCRTQALLLVVDPDAGLEARSFRAEAPGNGAEDFDRAALGGNLKRERAHGADADEIRQGNASAACGKVLNSDLENAEDAGHGHRNAEAVHAAGGFDGNAVVRDQKPLDQLPYRGRLTVEFDAGHIAVRAVFDW